MGESASDFSPRAYQVDLYERAVAENTLIYLPTGSGKTYIAVMLIKKYSNQLLAPYNEGGKRVIFVVNTVPLVSQQSDYIARHTGLNCKGYSGDMAVDFWSAEEWLQEIQQTQVMVMVSDIFLNVLNHGHMLLSSVCLLIFDECHKAVGSHPMRSIMKCFERYDKKEHPRILGLTATLLNANIKIEKVEATIRALEITFQARIATVESAISVKDFGNLTESFSYYDPPISFGVNDQLMEIANYMVKIINAVEVKGSFVSNESSKEFRPKSKNDLLKNLVEDARHHISTTGLYGGSKGIIMHMIQLECMKKFSEDPQTVSVLEFLVTQMTKMRKIMSDKMNGLTELEQIYKFSTDQILKLFSVLLYFNKTKSDDKKFCCIIFVHRRSAAQILYHILKNLRRLDERYEFLHPEFMVGHTNNPYKNPRESLCLSKWNKETLLRFRSGQSNCMVATEVVDEGVDVPSCTLILRYDLPVDFRGYIQSKGRARHIAGQYIMLIQNGDTNFLPRYHSFQVVEKVLKQSLVGHSDDRKEITAEEIGEHLYKTEIRPYTVQTQDGRESTVTGMSSISLINRYCVNLFKSKFVHLTPTWKLHRKKFQDIVHYQVSLTLPPMSLLRDTIHGDVMESIVLAKRSAALKACIKLHELGELSDRLLPIQPAEILQNADDLFPNWEDESKEESAIAGTTGKKRHHEIEYAESLYGAFPVANKPVYLHIIDAKPTYSKPYENRAMVFFDLLNDDAGFGILSTKPMPDIPSFPIFMNVGDLKVNVKVNNEKLTLCSAQIAELRQFHWTIFSHVLNIVKSFMAFDLANKGNSFLIVPTDLNGKINWEIVKKYEIVETLTPADNGNALDYELSLVTPNYRSSSSVYVVTQVCEDIMAESSFPTEDYYSYVHYYKERHGIIIHRVKQRMLEVKAISKKINCIRPRGLRAGLSKRKRADLLEDFEEHFVGELCNKIDFPALYWLKATYLPSVLHRISQLLVAEDLRVQIVNEANLGVLKLRSGTTWPPIVIEQLNSGEPIEDQLEISGWTADDSQPLESAEEPKVDLSGPEIDTLGMDSKLYPWGKDQEPANLFRDIENIQLIDIEYFHQFMSTPMDTNDAFLKNQRRSKQFASRSAVKAPPLKILTKEDSSGPSPGFIMQALTSKFAHDVFDLERLETLGDSFLKLAVSLYLFEAYPRFNEGQLTVIKGKLLGNRNLFYCGNNKRIPGRMKVDDFVPLSNFTVPAFCALRPLQQLLRSEQISPNVLYELMIPPNEQLSGVPSDPTLMAMQERVLSWNDSSTQNDMQNFLDVQVVPDKSVSDCVEALIGVYLSSMGLYGAFKILMWFGILPGHVVIYDLLERCSSTPRLGPGNPDDLITQAEYIENRIGYKFRDRTYLLQALTHPSFTPNRITPSYERLEFLGDAILDLLVTVHIYESCDYLSPGALTDLRSALVNNITFACLATKYGFHTALMSYAPKLEEIIERFVKFQEERNHAIDDELLWILLDEDECKIAEYVDVPKILGDLFESVIGAVYLDAGKDLNKVWEIVYGLMHNEIANFSKNVPKQPVRVIHETPGAKPRFSKSSVVDGTGSLMITLEVIIDGKPKIFHGFGANKKQAKRAAAKQALKCLRRDL